MDDAYIFIDDAVSGADVRRLRERKRMIELATTSRPFDVVVLQAQDRFSRAPAAETVVELKQLAKHVQIWFYADRQAFEHGTLASNVTGFLRAEFAAEFRRAIAQKTHEAMLRKAERGEVTGGRILGYDTVGKQRVINEAEARVVRDIYQR